MTGRYPRLYFYLKLLGLSPSKALECLIDASRGDKIARFWCGQAARIRRHK